MGVLHRDLKPQNLLVHKHEASGNLTLIIADFGLGRTVSLPNRPLTHEVVSLWYRAPEVLLSAKHYAAPVDVWSVGCIFFEMATGRPLFADPRGDEIGQLYQIVQSLGTPTEATWPGVTGLRDFSPHFPAWPRKSDGDSPLGTIARALPPDGFDLFHSLLRYSPEERINAKQARQHPYAAEAVPAARF